MINTIRSATTPQQQGWTLADTCATFTKLCETGIIGFYERFEATEIIAFHNGQKKQAPVNVFSLFVGEEGALNEIDQRLVFLNGKNRLSISGLPEWKFGIVRYSISVPALLSTLIAYQQKNIWNPSNTKALDVGSLHPIAPQFAPKDARESLPWNRVLKNNFWNGSHLLELADPEKRQLRHFLDQPVHLKNLSNEIGKHIPIGLSGFSDRLGNIIIQLPVTVLVANFSGRGRNDFSVDAAWHPKATARRLRATYENEFDKLITAYVEVDVSENRTKLLIPHPLDVFRCHLWDDINKVLLAATAPSAFFNGGSINIVVDEHEPRTFYAPGPDDKLRLERINLNTGASSTKKRVSTDEANSEWTAKRIYTDDVARMAAQKRFVQYGIRTSPAVEHIRAISDIRMLINMHGKHAAYLWDPYLQADDILKTLFYCMHTNADLKALTAGKAVPSDKQTTKCKHMAVGESKGKSENEGKCGSSPETENPMTRMEIWQEAQKSRLENAKGNAQGLQMEFRLNKGQEGWAFHDRFLIFPRLGGALAWSLGTSVNSLGREHHILQQVADGQMVLDAFNELWYALNKADHVIWKIS